MVPKDHADSNYKLAMDGFLSKVLVWIIFDELTVGWLKDGYNTEM